MVYIFVDKNFLKLGVFKGVCPLISILGGSQRQRPREPGVPWERTKAFPLKAEWHEMLLFLPVAFFLTRKGEKHGKNYSTI
jgi:hypothetical protein